MYRSYIYDEKYIQMWEAFIGNTMKYGGFNRFEMTLEWGLSRANYWRIKYDE